LGFVELGYRGLKLVEADKIGNVRIVVMIVEDRLLEIYRRLEWAERGVEHVFLAIIGRILRALVKLATIKPETLFNIGRFNDFSASDGLFATAGWAHRVELFALLPASRASVVRLALVAVEGHAARRLVRQGVIARENLG
jgi:hypothetical protein